jgi:hypothetical protein
MDIEKVKEIKELLRCMNGEKACTNCYINEIAQEQETCCVNVISDMTLELINELESEVEGLKCELQKTRKETATALTVNVENMLIWVTRNNNAIELYEEHLHKELKIIAKEYGVEYQEDFD